MVERIDDWDLKTDVSSGQCTLKFFESYRPGRDARTIVKDLTLSEVMKMHDACVRAIHNFVGTFR